MPTGKDETRTSFAILYSSPKKKLISTLISKFKGYQIFSNNHSYQVTIMCARTCFLTILISNN